MIPITNKRVKELILVVLWLAAALVLIMWIEGAAEETGSPKKEGVVEATGDGLKAFEKVRAVLQSPRCQNCHIPGDAPLVGNQGKPHGMNVKRGEDGRGKTAMRCTNCHQEKNGDMPHTPPGAFDWHLPPPSTPMVFINLSPGELCSNLKDPSKNGGRTPAHLMDHLAKDRLVLWGWDPGPGRTKPPISHEEFVAGFSRWMTAGMPCP